MRRAQLFNQRRKPRLQKPLLYLARALRSWATSASETVHALHCRTVVVDGHMCCTKYPGSRGNFHRGFMDRFRNMSRRGDVDRVQCRVRYTKSSENSYATSSVCTTENGRYDISGHVTKIGDNSYQGTVTSGNETAES